MGRHALNIVPLSVFVPDSNYSAPILLEAQLKTEVTEYPGHPLVNLYYGFAVDISIRINHIELAY